MLEVEAAVQQVLQQCRLQETNLLAENRLKEVEMQEAEAAQLLLAESRREDAEVRAERASERCNAAVESTTATKRDYQLEIDEMQKEGEMKEASALEKLLAAEKSLATALFWCGKQSQIGLKMFTAEEMSSRVQVDAVDRISVDGE